MPSDSSITRLISGLKQGDDQAAQAIWERFFQRLTAVARKRLGSLPKRVADEEDLALSALNALCTGAREGRFRQLENRSDLWQILVMITVRKVSNARRKQAIRQERGESALDVTEGEPQFFAELLESAPSDQLVDSMSACCEEMLAMLNEKLREVALLKLAGHTNLEVARLRQRSVKTIERYLKLIRAEWDALQNPQ